MPAVAEEEAAAVDPGVADLLAEGDPAELRAGGQIDAR